jgi:Sensors of blue-light using FAD
MFSLTYVSSALQPFSPRELRDLLDRCNENNRRRSVTGMLLYKNCSFMQVLEGEENVVLAVHETISRDPRHRAINTLLRGEIAGRQFPNWSMGFKDLGADIDNPEGYSEFLNASLIGEEFKREPTKAQQFLLLFKKDGAI